MQHETISPETVIARARARATMQTKPVLKPLSQIPFPTIVPTTYTARFVESTTQAQPHGSNQEETLELPSSPPSSQEGADDKNLAHAPTETPAVTEPRTPVQLSSPVSNPDRGSDSRVNSTTKWKISTHQRSLRQGGLTSSVVKGEAANGLLELMRGSSDGDSRVAQAGGIGMCGL